MFLGLTVSMTIGILTHIVIIKTCNRTVKVKKYIFSGKYTGIFYEQYLAVVGRSLHSILTWLTTRVLKNVMATGQGLKQNSVG